MDVPRGLLASKSLWTSNKSGRHCLGFHIPDEIFAVFFILVILSLAKDEEVMKKVQENRSVQIAIGILVIYCLYNKIPWSLAFILGFVIAVSFTNVLSDAKGTFTNIMEGLKRLTKVTKATKDNKTLADDRKDDNMMRMGARVLKMAKTKDESLKGILKKPEKKVTFNDVESESDSESDDEMCTKVSKMFGFDPESDAETTDNETEEDHEIRKDDLINFVMNEEKNVSKS